jgi:hypothetical protein
LKFKNCDQLGANIAAAQERWRCKLELRTTEWLIEEVERRYDPQTEDFDTTLENALRAKDIEQSVQWEAYKMVLGLFFGNRSLHKQGLRGRA